MPLGTELRLLLRRIPAIARWFLRASPQKRVPFVHTLAERRSPLRRTRTPYAEHVQRAKEQNVARVAALLDGIAIAPGEIFSWHAVIGPPLRSRGFASGPELRGGELASGIGGGACQASNLLFWLAVHSGLRIVERHRHSLDLFPDDQRDVPFGCGATVHFPRKDLRLHNPHAFTVVLSFRVSDGALYGAVSGERALMHTYRLVERDARVEQRSDGSWRMNTLERHTLDAQGRTLAVETLCENIGRLCYEPLREIA